MGQKKTSKNVAEVKYVATDNQIDEIIGEIFKIEATALGIQSDTEREKEEYASAIAKQTKEFDSKLAEETTKRLELLKRQLKKEKEEELSAMRDNIMGNVEKMEKLYKANHKIWAKNIVDSILKE